MDPNEIDPNDIASVQQIDPDQIASIEQVQPQVQSYNQNTKANVNGSVISPGIPDSYHDEAMQGAPGDAKFRGLAQGQKNFQSAMSGAFPMIGTVMDKTGYALREQGNRIAPNLIDAPQGSIDTADTLPTSANAMIQRSVQQRPVANMVGQMLSPANAIGKIATGLPTLGRMAVGALEQGGISAANAFAGGRDTQEQGAVGAAIGAAVPGVARAGSGLLDILAAKMAPKALEFVKSMADHVLRSKAPLDNGAMVRAPSKMGLGSLYEDILYKVIEKLDPKFAEGTLAKELRFGTKAREAGQEVQGALQKANETMIPAGQLSNDLEGLARRSQLDTGRQGAVGGDIAKVIRSEFNAQPTRIAQAARPTSFQMGPPNTETLPTRNIGQNASLPMFDEQAGGPSNIMGANGQPIQKPRSLKYQGDEMASFEPDIKQAQPQDAIQVGAQTANDKVSLGQLNQRRMEITSPEFKPAYQVSSPDVVPVRAGERVRDYMTQKAGYTPAESARLEAANLDNQLTSKAQQIFSNNSSRNVGGMTQNSVRGTAYGYVGQQIREKAPSVLYAASKQAAERAMARLDRRFGTGQMTNMSPFQADLLRSKLNAISMMDPKDAAPYVYAQSMTNPVFRQIWNERDNDD